MVTKRLGLLTLAAGAGLVVAAQLLAPLHAPPLYDGVVVAEPYRYLSPTGGQAGNPTSASVVKPLENGKSPALSAATAESPPQAQVIAPPEAFAAPPGATELHISITPIAPSPPDSIVGNAYRFAVTDQVSNPVPLASGVQPTVVLRAPDEAYDVKLVDLVGDAWHDLATQSGGQPGEYLANVDALGVAAARGTISPDVSGLDPRFVLAAALVAVGSVIALLVLFRPRRAATSDVSRPVRRSPVPRKRRRRR